MTIRSPALPRICALLALPVLIGIGPDVGTAVAQTAAAPATATKTATSTTAPLTAPQVEQLVAPIALYPDPLLAQVLMASTYPLEVVEAARWSQANPGVTGEALEDAMQKQQWDPNVKALTAVPDVLRMMNDKLQWTRDLGDAFLAQQSDVLDAVQRLRARADAAGNLKTTKDQKITKTARAQAKPSGAAASAPAASSAAAPNYVYAIEPTNPDDYAVPVYDPGVVYGAWPYADYQPFYWYPPGWAVGGAIGFTAGVLVGRAIWGSINWRNNIVGINPLRYNGFNRTRITSTSWVHSAAHRGAVPYRNNSVAQRFGNPGHAAAREAGRQALNNRHGTGTGAGRHHGHAGTGTARNGAGTGAVAKGAKTRHAGAGSGTRHRQGTGTKTARTTSRTAHTRVSGGGRSGHKSAARSVSRSHVSAARSLGGGGGGHAMAMRGGGGGFRGGGGGRGGGGRRSDIRLKHDIALIARLDDGLGFYRFVYNGDDTVYVGVMAQEVQKVAPAAVVRDRDGYLSVLYDRIGVRFQTYADWLAAGAPIPHPMRH